METIEQTYTYIIIYLSCTDTQEPIIIITALWEVLAVSLYPQVWAEALTPPSFFADSPCIHQSPFDTAHVLMNKHEFLIGAPASGRTVGWLSWGILTEKAWTPKKDFLLSPRRQGGHGVLQDSPGILTGDFTANIPHLFSSGKWHWRSSYCKLLFRLEGSDYEECFGPNGVHLKWINWH